MKTKIVLILAVLVSFEFQSCSKNSGSSGTPSPTLVLADTVIMSTKNEIPAIAGRAETATAILQLFSDNTLQYNIVVTNLTAGDAITASHIHLGNAGSNGSVYIPFSSSGIYGSTISGTVQLTSTQADTLKTIPAYVNVHTTQAPGGLIRGQIDSKVVLAADIVMLGTNEVPSVSTTASGLATIRMTQNKNLYVKVVVSNLEAGDSMRLAHFHSAAAGINGSVILGFYTTNADFGTLKIIAVDNPTYTSLLNDALYVNAHSSAHPAGIIRGQLR